MVESGASLVPDLYTGTVKRPPETRAIEGLQQVIQGMDVEGSQRILIEVTLMAC